MEPTRRDGSGILVVAPTRRELGGLRPGHHGALSATVVGLGEEAAPALTELLAAEHPSAVLSLGFAGALTAQGRTGDLVLCMELVSGLPTPSDPLAADAALADSVRRGLEQSGLPSHQGKLLTVPSPLLAPDEKRSAGASSGALAVDMEGHAMAQAALEQATPFLALRVVLDPVGYPLPGLVADIMADGGRRELRHTLRWAATNPAGVPRLISLAYRARRAQQALRRATHALLPHLGAPPS